MALAVLLAAPVCNAAAQDAKQLQLLNASLEPRESLEFEIPSGSTAMTKTVFLRRRDSADVATKNVRLSLELTAGTATLLRQGDVSATTPFTIPAGSDEAITITVTLAADTQAKGALVALVDGKAERLATVRAQAAAAPKVAIAENSGGIKRSATSTDYTLFLTLTANQSGAQQVTVSVPDLTDGTGTQVPVTVAVDGQSGPINLLTNGTARVSISAQLSRAGDYAGGLIVVHDGIREDPVPLTITRSQIQPTVEILAFTSLQDPDLDSVQLEALVQETSGSPIVLGGPVLIPLGRKAGETRVGPSFASADVTIERLDEVSGEFEDVGDELALEGGETVTLHMTISDIGEPGDYAARLRLATPDSSAVSEDASFSLRRPWLVATVLILIGVLISMLVREVFLRRGARARQGLDLRRLADDLKRLQDRQDKLDPTAQAAFDALDRRIYDLYEGGSLSTIAAEIEKINLQMTLLGGWLRVRRRLAGLRPPARDPFPNRLDRVLERVHSSSDSKDVLTAETAALTQLEADVDQALRRQLRDEIEALKKAAEEAAGANGYVRKAAPRASINDKVLPALTEALGKLDEDTDVDANLLAASQSLAGARAQYVSALVHDLTLVLAEEPPPGMGGPEWVALRERVSDVIATAGGDPERQLNAYRTALGLYLPRVAQAASEHARERREALEKAAGSSPTPSQKKALELYSDATKEADSVAALLASGGVAAAHAAYAKAVEKILEGDKNAAGTQGLSPAPSLPAVPGQPPPAEGIGPENLADVGRDHPDIPDRSKLLAAIAWSELGILLAAAFLATLLGLSLLYVPNATWGGEGDIILALLWGAGLYQVTGQTVHGYRSVQTTLTAP